MILEEEILNASKHYLVFEFSKPAWRVYQQNILSQGSFKEKAKTRATGPDF